MRSFAVIAGFAAAANGAAVYGYPAESSSVAVYVPVYPVETSSAAYVASTPAAEYPAESTPAAYSSEAPAYSTVPVYATTEVVYGLTTICPEPTTITYGTKTYTVTSATTLVDDDCEYTTTYEVKPTPSAVKTPVHSEYSPPKYSSPAAYVPYPSSNGTVPVPAGTAAPTGAKPSSTKPSSPEFTGAASRMAAGALAVAGAAFAALI